MLIIGAVLVAGGLFAWYMFSSAKSAPRSNTNTNTAANSKVTPVKADSIPPNAPPGANPPNQAGSPSAAVTLEEFADFQCGSCAAAHPIMNEIKSTYGSRIRFVFRNYPLSIAAHDKAYEAAVAVEAAGMQGKFWDLQNLLFNNQQIWTAAPTYKQIWKDYAAKVGLDVAKWENDMAGIAAKSRVDADIARGRAIGVNSTPSVYINGSAVPYTEIKVASLKALIDAEIQKSNAANAPAQPAASDKPADASK